MRQGNTTPDIDFTPIRNPNLLTVRQLVEKHHAFSENQVRWLIFHRGTNGFAHCFLKLGKKRILIDEDAFFAQIEKGRMGVAA